MVVIPDALDKIARLTGYNGKKDGQDFSGIIAQDLQAVLPQIVHAMGQYKMQDGTVVDDMLYVSYGEMAGLFVEAIKELTAKVNAQEKDILALKNSVS